MTEDRSEVDNTLRNVANLAREQDLLAIAEGLSQMEAGQGRPLDEAFDEMRRRLGFPTQH